MSYRVNHYAYCGMSGVPEDFSSREDARDYAAQRLRSYRKRFEVVTLEKGKRWEVLEPEDCSMVPDACGELVLTRKTFECRECGSSHDDRDAAAGCCHWDGFNDSDGVEVDDNDE